MRHMTMAVATVLLLGSPAAAEGLIPIDHVAAGTPFAAVGRIHLGTGAYCTGVLVARDKAITAAHCLYNQRTGHWVAPGSVHFLLGYDRGSYGFHSRAVSYETGGYEPARPPEARQGDWALIRLEQRAPSEYPSLEAMPGSYGADRTFRLLGYASPRRYALSATPECTAVERSGFLASECPSANGMSGAPMIDIATGRLVGIQIAMMSASGRDLIIAVPAGRWAGRH